MTEVSVLLNCPCELACIKDITSSFQSCFLFRFFFLFFRWSNSEIEPLRYRLSTRGNPSQTPGRPWTAFLWAGNWLLKLFPFLNGVSPECRDFSARGGFPRVRAHYNNYFCYTTIHRRRSWEPFWVLTPQLKTRCCCRLRGWRGSPVPLTLMLSLCLLFWGHPVNTEVMV